MIEAFDISKKFDTIPALDRVSLTIRDGSIFGLIGTNGAGKSTFMRILSGVLCSDSGRILIDGEEVYENPEAKRKLFYISDEQYYPENSTPNDLLQYYSGVYAGFLTEQFTELTSQFGLDRRRKINTFSKGMKKQLSVICALCSGTRYILCDETFDGLDPVMRQAVKSLFAREMANRGLTPVIASHNLREIEDICDSVGLLHRGGVLLSKDIDDMRENLCKVQCAFAPETEVNTVFKGLNLLKQEQRGSLYTLTIRGDREQLPDYFAGFHPLFFELLPLSLEEIFISETEVTGYDIKSLIF
jgi:ABC-2 type transport system ATP-binding protein